jgi:hypothetical protein
MYSNPKKTVFFGVDDLPNSEVVCLDQDLRKAALREGNTLLPQKLLKELFSI